MPRTGRASSWRPPVVPSGLALRGAVLYLLVGTLWFSACKSATAPTDQLPERAVALTPPAAYRAWWQVVQACSGLTGDFNAVRWYTVPGSTAFTVSGGTLANGAWYSNGNMIVVAGDSANSGAIVRHEMLHALIGPVSGHPVAYYGAKCGGQVACSSSCASEVAAGSPATDFTAPIVTPKQVTIEATTVPATFAEARANNWVTLIISVSNPGGTAVRVRPPFVSQFSAASVVWGYNYNGQPRSETLFLTGDGTIFIPAGTTKKRAFDVFVSGLDSFARLRGAFGAESTAVVTLPP